jgi:hypothetical protein
MNMEDLRLSRIEEKLDKLADAVVSLARMEERMLTLFKRIEYYEDRQQKIEDRVSTIEKEDAGKNSIFRAVDKISWLLIGAALTYVIHYLGK